jgi:2-polyprenyl-3-methyl-5-hydroxy-6-metoxy-1,4-benzoquinol methylase
MSGNDSQPDCTALAARLFPGRSNPVEILNRLRPRIMPANALMAAVPRDARLLDIGCGAGLFIGLLAASGRIRAAVGFDMSVPAITLANQMRGRLPENRDITFIQLSVEDPWPEGQFDAVSLIDVMHHIPPAAQIDVLRAAAAKVRPGGRLIYKDMAERPAWMALANRLHDLVVARDWIHYLPLARARETLTGMGFQPVDETRTRTFWYMHEILVMEAPA